MAEQIFEADLTDSVGAAWDRFIDEAAPFRPELFAFALKLTGNPFDAEDLVHEGLLRAFGAMAFQYGRVRKPRSYIFRVLSNLWIDEVRRARPLTSEAETVEAEDPAMNPDESVEIWDAARTMLGVLSPREAAAVVLKEVCGFAHAEIADLLSTSEGAVKVALHRGKKRLAEHRTAPVRAPRVSRALVERFVVAMRAADLEALKAMMVGSVEADTFPSGVGVGIEHHEKEGWLNGCLYHHIHWREESGTPFPLRLEVESVDDEPVVLVFRDFGEGEALEEVWRFEEDLEEGEGRIARVRDYGFCPDLVRYVAERLNLPFRPVGYRFQPDIYADPDSAASQ